MILPTASIKNVLMNSQVGRQLLGEALRIKYRKYLESEFAVDIHPTMVLDAIHKHARHDDPWFLNAFLAQSQDAVGCEVLRFIKEHTKQDATIFESGCGIGTYLLWFAQNGYRNLYGSDILPTLVKVAKELSSKKDWKADFWVDNGFSPIRVPDSCDVILAIRWVFSAWGGNYSDENRAFRDLDRLDLLRNIIACYADHVADGGYFVIQLVDKLSDHKVIETGVYPVRHSKDDVTRCCGDFGFQIEKMYINWSHQILATYILRKHG